MLVHITTILYDGSMSELVLERRDGPVSVLTLNDPERANPLSAALADRLYRALADAAEDHALRAIVLTGAGRHFSAGADLAALERLAVGGTEADNREDSERLERLYAELLDHPKLTVAAVHGAAIGGGCGLATACDLVIASERARLGLPEVRLGCYPPVALALYPRRIGLGRTLELALTGRIFDVGEATRLGLVDEVVAAELLAERARELAAAIGAHSAAVTRLAVRAARAGADRPFASALNEAERIYLRELAGTEDMKEGLAAFAQKRAPAWRNR